MCMCNRMGVQRIFFTWDGNVFRARSVGKFSHRAPDKSLTATHLFSHFTWWGGKEYTRGNKEIMIDYRVWYDLVWRFIVWHWKLCSKRPVHSSVWCNFFVTRLSKKITWIFKELCLCWFSSKRKYRLISPLAIHIYFFY